MAKVPAKRTRRRKAKTEQSPVASPVAEHSPQETMANFAGALDRLSRRVGTIDAEVASFAGGRTASEERIKKVETAAEAMSSRFGEFAIQLEALGPKIQTSMNEHIARLEAQISELRPDEKEGAQPSEELDRDLAEVVARINRRLKVIESRCGVPT